MEDLRPDVVLAGAPEIPIWKVHRQHTPDIETRDLAKAALAETMVDAGHDPTYFQRWAGSRWLFCRCIDCLLRIDLRYDIANREWVVVGDIVPCTRGTLSYVRQPPDPCEPEKVAGTIFKLTGENASASRPTATIYERARKRREKRHVARQWDWSNAKRRFAGDPGFVDPREQHP